MIGTIDVETIRPFYSLRGTRRATPGFSVVTFKVPVLSAMWPGLNICIYLARGCHSMDRKPVYIAITDKPPL